MNIDDANTRLLGDQIRHGNVILFLGAGINSGATNGAHQEIKTGTQLEASLRDKTSIMDDDIKLGDLVDEYRRIFGDAGVNKLFYEEFSDCTPSDDQKKLLAYSWSRIYTLNIDDALENVPRKTRAQRVKPINRNDPIEELRHYEQLQLVHLNGFIKNLDQGFVFTPSQYRSEIRGASSWYSKCAIDFFDKIFIFLGTKLDEAVFDAYVEEISRNRGALAPKSFLINSTKPSDIKIRKLAEKNIVWVDGTLHSFVEFMRVHIGESLSPTEIAAYISGREATDQHPSALVTSVEQIGTIEWITRYRVAREKLKGVSRDFFSGFAPTWDVIVNNASVTLNHDSIVFNSVKNKIGSESHVILISGQSGSGKTTTLMKAGLRIAIELHKNVFLLNEGTKEKLSAIVTYLGRINNRSDVVLLINNIIIFADELYNLELLLKEHHIYLVAQCRTRDWEGRLNRSAPIGTTQVNLPALADDDFARLCDGIIEHGVAPHFLNIEDRNKQIAFLKKSQRQLLLLMKEATQQRRFEEIIEDEFRSVEKSDARAAFCIVGLATLAKSTISMGELQVVLSFVDRSYSAEKALSQLGGIVVAGPAGLAGRHELYVRHIFDIVLSSQEIKDSIVGFLRYFVQFGRPIIVKLGRQRGNLFKFLLNYEWLHELFKNKNDLIMAERVYSSIEHEYQRDGHYWLQRGLFYRKRKKHDVARDYLEKSVAAYPDSFYARHALAQQKLIGAALIRNRARTTELDLEEAIKELNWQIDKRGGSDEYPLVTLAWFHPEVLLRWGDIEGARGLASEYFQRLEAFRKSLPRVDKSVDVVRSACLSLYATGKWKGPRY